jgi:mono/diheme cytochrome c family protein
MRSLIWFLAGAFTLAAAMAAGGWVYLRTQAGGFSAKAQPGAVERWVALRARAMALPAAARERANPVQASLRELGKVLADARAHWADHCASCHANDGSGDVAMGKRMYPPAPDMRQAATQNLSDGELFYIIENGIRFTGMPAWGGSDHGAEDSWKLVHFIRHLPAMTLEERKQMEKLNPRSPEELKEEAEEEKFLKGESTNEPQPQHHHH